MRLVVDASVGLKWFFRDQADEAGADAALDILRAHVAGRHSIMQPPHFLAEVCAALAREAPQTMTENLRDLLDLAIPTRSDAAIFARAMQLSHALDHHLFDTLYHAVALETEAAVLVTADDRYLNKAQGFGQLMRLSDWRVER